jgi:hypothetical protein
MSESGCMGRWTHPKAGSEAPGYPLFIVSLKKLKTLHYIAKECLLEKGGWLKTSGFKWNVHRETEWEVLDMG